MVRDIASGDFPETSVFQYGKITLANGDSHFQIEQYTFNTPVQMVGTSGLPPGEVREGLFRAPLPAFEFGKITYQNGGIAEGPPLPVSGLRKVTYPSGFVVEGLWEFNVFKHGRVTLEDGCIEEGVRSAGWKLQGFGRRTFPTGQVFEGVFDAGMFKSGTFTFASGRREEGARTDQDRLHGWGRRTSPCGGRVAEGMFVDGFFKSGTLTINGHIHEGAFSAGGRLHGHGKITSPNGQVQEGYAENAFSCNYSLLNVHRSKWQLMKVQALFCIRLLVPRPTVPCKYPRCHVRFKGV